ncbi:hypothetical protein A0H81_13741 [Grifola frondosa]|uniref:Uncharacterized protein n=1 Tax=Grifola frondosa TaxID=5627 RepID=A0A1C7LNE5_GRIFR|nr:hypothetical protein A0H81_13741 [Grifola frondosa]
MLERGEDALADIDGRDESSNEVRVAAAFISISTSPPSPPPPVPKLPPPDLSLAPLRVFVFVWEVSAVRADFTVLRAGGVTSFTRCGAGMGGSWGLWMVRARFAGGGANNDENRLCVAEAVTGGGGAIEPLRASIREELLGVMALPPDVAG